MQTCMSPKIWKQPYIRLFWPLFEVCHEHAFQARGDCKGTKPVWGWQKALDSPLPGTLASPLLTGTHCGSELPAGSTRSPSNCPYEQAGRLAQVLSSPKDKTKERWAGEGLSRWRAPISYEHADKIAVREDCHSHWPCCPQRYKYYQRERRAWLVQTRVTEHVGSNALTGLRAISKAAGSICSRSRRATSAWRLRDNVSAVHKVRWSFVVPRVMKGTNRLEYVAAPPTDRKRDGEPARTLHSSGRARGSQLYFLFCRWHDRTTGVSSACVMCTAALSLGHLARVMCAHSV